MSEELKACPFCGIDSNLNIGTHSANCLFYFLSENVTDRSVKVIAWNTRPIEDALRKQLDELKKYTKRLHKLLMDETDIDLTPRPAFYETLPEFAEELESER